MNLVLGALLDKVLKIIRARGPFGHEPAPPEPERPPFSYEHVEHTFMTPLGPVNVTLDALFEGDIVTLTDITVYPPRGIASYPKMALYREMLAIRRQVLTEYADRGFKRAYGDFEREPGSTAKPGKRPLLPIDLTSYRTK